MLYAGDGRLKLACAQLSEQVTTAPSTEGVMAETESMRRAKHAETDDEVDSCAQRSSTLSEFLAFVSLSSFSSSSTKAPIGITTRKITPTDFTRIPRLLATIPWENS